MVAITSVVWIPRANVRNDPLTLEDEVNAMVDVEETTASMENEPMDSGVEPMDSVAAEFDLENYDNDQQNDGLFGLSVDELLKLKEESEQLSKEVEEALSDGNSSIDLSIPTKDYVFACAMVSEKEEMGYETYTYDHDVGEMYQHHDAVLDWVPLCIESIPGCKGREGNNYVALAGFAPWIEIWDNDYIDPMEPVAILGKRKNKSLQEVSHPDDEQADTAFAIRSLHFNMVDSKTLAAGNTQGVVELWDIHSHKRTEKIGKKGQQPGISGVRWHTHEATLLATCGDNQFVSLLDTRTPDSGRTLQPGTLTGNVEGLSWDRHRPYILMTVGDRFTGIDIRKFGDKTGILWSIEYDSRFLAVTDTLGNYNETIGYPLFVVNGMVATTTEEGVCSIWNCTKQPPYEVTGKDFNNGPLHSIIASPDLRVPTVLLMGGRDMIVWDLIENETAAKTFTSA